MYKHTVRPNAVVIGRFQPFHLGHQDLIQFALNKYEKVCVVLGSAQKSPSVKNPFTPQVRELMIRSSFTSEENNRLRFVEVRDWPYHNNHWKASVKTKSSTALDCTDHDIDLVGHFKDGSSFYLNMFPEWGFTRSEVKQNGLSATDIRDQFLEPCDNYLQFVSLAVQKIMQEFQTTDMFDNLCSEFKYNKKYKEDTRFINASFSPTFMTADAVVVQSGHLLVVQRKFNPGKGLYALPGGFVGQEETVENAAIRELKEETKIMVDKRVLQSRIQASHLFDQPDRSMRGRVITMAYYITLADSLSHGLPKVSGGDDAKTAMWMPLEDLSLNEDKFFEDHAHIVRFFTKTV